jgi:hypothetical protein
LLLGLDKICSIVYRYLICIAALSSSISAAYFNNFDDYTFAFAFIIKAYDFLRVEVTIENTSIIYLVKNSSK